MEFGAEVVAHYRREVLVAAKENAGVNVVNMCSSLGQNPCVMCM